MDTKGLQKEFIDWCKSNKKQPKSKEETQQLFVTFMKEKHPEEYKAAMESQLKQAQKALHGAKLNYFKSLKHQCAENEEVVYYKKGGSVTCGCKKKEEGGEVSTAKCGSTVEKFKKRKMNSGGNFLTNLLFTAAGMQRGYEKATEKPKAKPKKKLMFQGKEQDIVGKTLKRGNENSGPKAKGPVDEALADNKGYGKNKCGGKVKKHQEGSVITKFKALRKGGSLNGIPFMQAGTPKGGIEKSDNTRVLRVPNNGEGVYEMTPQGIGDFLPLVGTWRAAQRIDNGEPNANYGDLAMNAAMDLLGARMIGPVIKAVGKAKRIHNALKANGFRLVGPEPTKFIKTGNRTKLSRGYMDPNKYYHINLGPEVIAEKTIPNVDYYNIAMLPMILSLRVPATAPFK